MTGSWGPLITFTAGPLITFTALVFIVTAYFLLSVLLAPPMTSSWGPLITFTALVFIVTAYFLLPVLLAPTLLWAVYFAYTIVAVVLFHLIIFGCESVRAQSGRHLSKSVPKYLEYAYTVVVSGSLLQIFVYAPRVADYVTWLQGDETYLVGQIKRVAESYLEDECINRGTRKHVETRFLWIFSENTNFYFTPQYCDKVAKIVHAPDLKEYILSAVVTDREFLDHIIEDLPDIGAKLGLASPNGGELASERSPIEQLVNRFEVVHEFLNMKERTNSAGSNRLAWIGMLLLPIGIALKLVKTSLELFVPLQ